MAEQNALLRAKVAAHCRGTSNMASFEDVTIKVASSVTPLADGTEQHAGLSQRYSELQVLHQGVKLEHEMLIKKYEHLQADHKALQGKFNILQEKHIRLEEKKNSLEEERIQL